MRRSHQKRTRVAYISVSLFAVLLLGAAGFYLYVVKPPAQPPTFAGEKPAIDQDGYVSHTEEVIVNVPIAQYRELVGKVEIKDALKGTSGIPSVAGTKVIKGTWSEAGARRRVSLDGGHFAAEESLVHTPDLFRYQVWGFTNYGKLVSDYAIGEFYTQEADGKTRVRWTYSFHKNSIISEVFLPRFVDTSWAAFMHSSLNNTKQSVEHAAEETR